MNIEEQGQRTPHVPTLGNMPLPPLESKEELIARTTRMFDVSNPSVLRQFMADYPELAMLAGNVAATPEGLIVPNGDQKLSELLYCEQKIELDRTLVGVLCLKWLLEKDYGSFTACQPEAVRLTPESFEELSFYTEEVINKPVMQQALTTFLIIRNLAKINAEGLDSMVTYMGINDLTKISAVVEDIKNQWEVENVDHDKLLFWALQHHPEISPSFLRLEPEYRKLILESLSAEFNVGQFIQGENVAASLSGLWRLTTDALNFYLLHAVCDVAGAAGHVNQKGSVVMTEPTWQGFKMAIHSLCKLTEGVASPLSAYDHYLGERAALVGFDLNNETDRALTRIACMLRSFDLESGKKIRSVFSTLPANIQSLLTQELNRNGVDNGWASLLYYSPAALANAQAAFKEQQDPEWFEKGLEVGLLAFGRAFHEGMVATKGRKGSGVYTLMVSDLAVQAKTPEKLQTSIFNSIAQGEDGVVQVTPAPTIDRTKFQKLNSLGDLQGKRVVVIGIGGGSDSAQAAQLGYLLKDAGKEVASVVSVRTARTGSQGKSGSVGQDRALLQHGGEVASGVFKILPETSVEEGRFFENLAANDFPSYLIKDHEDGTLVSQLEALLDSLGTVDCIIAVDTGGDALYPTVTSTDVSKATPDQDLRVLRALQQIGIPGLTCEIACGVDSPKDVEQRLLEAQARFFQLSEEQRVQVLARYIQWEMDGSNEQRYGKTPLAWQAALQGKRGVTALNIPPRFVTDRKNPWNPFVVIMEAMEGMFFMNLKNHLKALEGEGH
jgi:hypothetical protein